MSSQGSDGSRPDPKTYNYSNPTRRCDIVMKGGVTSGVVYPFAVCELARTYQFQSIGGTSAGAIAAAATAAAELGRHSPTGGFRRLAELPEWLGTGTHLFDLFQPQPATKRLFSTLTAGIGRGSPVRKIVAAAMRNFPLWVLSGIVPGLVLLVAALQDSRGFLLGWAILSAGLLTLGGGLLGLLLGIYRAATRAIPANRFGLCSGAGDPRPGQTTPLTTWLATELDLLAGKGAESAVPLTFGDLWRGPAPGHPSHERAINLEMMTTSLSHGRPYRLPFDDPYVWFFDPEEFRALFPERIVRWMEDHPPAPPSQPAERRWWELLCKLLVPLRPVPAAPDVPVVAAARLSLSFPLLISAVPLWAVDWTRVPNGLARQAWREWSRQHEVDWEKIRDDVALWEQVPKLAERPTPSVCWFSDGGITSNFPVHFFDAPIPRWPTFAINLRPFHPDYPWQPEECQNVWMPHGNAGGIAERWTPIEAKPGLLAVAQFLHAIVETMRNWMDNTQMRVPGYRDRVAHISLSPEEGGLNLTMPAGRIVALSERGRCAGEQLAQRFGPTPPPDTVLTWDNHRWVRYRSTMAVIQTMFTKLRRAYVSPPNAGNLSYEELIQRGEDTPPTSYRWERATQRAFALDATRELMSLSAYWEERDESFAEGAPGPTPELRIRPRV